MGSDLSTGRKSALQTSNPPQQSSRTELQSNNEGAPLSSHTQFQGASFPGGPFTPRPTSTSSLVNSGNRGGANSFVQSSTLRSEHLSPRRQLLSQGVFRQRTYSTSPHRCTPAAAHSSRREPYDSMSPFKLNSTRSQSSPRYQGMNSPRGQSSPRYQGRLRNEESRMEIGREGRLNRSRDGGRKWIDYPLRQDRYPSIGDRPAVCFMKPSKGHAPSLESSPHGAGGSVRLSVLSPSEINSLITAGSRRQTSPTNSPASVIHQTEYHTAADVDPIMEVLRKKEGRKRRHSSGSSAGNVGNNLPTNERPGNTAPPKRSRYLDSAEPKQPAPLPTESSFSFSPRLQEQTRSSGTTEQMEQGDQAMEPSQDASSALQPQDTPTSHSQGASAPHRGCNQFESSRSSFPVVDSPLVGGGLGGLEEIAHTIETSPKAYHISDHVMEVSPPPPYSSDLQKSDLPRSRSSSQGRASLPTGTETEEGQEKTAESPPPASAIITLRRGPRGTVKSLLPEARWKNGITGMPPGLLKLTQKQDYKENENQQKEGLAGPLLGTKQGTSHAIKTLTATSSSPAGKQQQPNSQSEKIVGAAAVLISQSEKVVGATAVLNNQSEKVVGAIAVLTTQSEKVVGAAAVTTPQLSTASISAPSVSVSLHSSSSISPPPAGSLVNIPSGLSALVSTTGSGETTDSGGQVSSGQRPSRGQVSSGQRSGVSTFTVSPTPSTTQTLCFGQTALTTNSAGSTQGGAPVSISASLGGSNTSTTLSAGTIPANNSPSGGAPVPQALGSITSGIPLRETPATNSSSAEGAVKYGSFSFKQALTGVAPTTDSSTLGPSAPSGPGGFKFGGISSSTTNDSTGPTPLKKGFNFMTSSSSSAPTTSSLAGVGVSVIGTTGPVPATSLTGAFGQTVQQPATAVSTPYNNGITTTPTISGSLSTANTAGGAGLFGGSNTSAAGAAAGGLFGGSTSTPAVGGPGLFGGMSGAATSGAVNLFGGAPTAPTAGGGLFSGSTTASKSATGGIFGGSGTINAPALNPGPFGATASSAAGGPFGGNLGSSSNVTQPNSVFSSTGSSNTTGATNGGFQFGSGGSSNTTGATNGGFQFGVGTATAGSAGGFTFGTGSSNSAVAASKPASTGGFTFGTGNKNTGSSTGFPFGQPAVPSFGSSTTGSTPTGSTGSLAAFGTTGTAAPVFGAAAPGAAFGAAAPGAAFGAAGTAAPGAAFGAAGTTAPAFGAAGAAGTAAPAAVFGTAAPGAAAPSVPSSFLFGGGGGFGLAAQAPAGAAAGDTSGSHFSIGSRPMAKGRVRVRRTAR